VNRTAAQLEFELFRDLETLGERLADEEFSSDLYQALANTIWRKPDILEGHVSVSWKRAEEIINEVRARRGHAPLALAQTGGEGGVSALVARELGALGWKVEPLDISSSDPDHRTRPKSPPPQEQGERQAPVEDSHAWERLAHEEAEQKRRRTTPVRPPRPPI
jgi:hypothetical protein